MVDTQTLANIAWGVTTGIELALLASLLRLKLYRSHPAFALYIVSTIIQSALQFLTYRHWGDSGDQTFIVSWAVQGIVSAVRWMAIYEIARGVLSPYLGIWVLAKRILFALSSFVLVYSIALSHDRWYEFVVDTNRGLHVAAAVFLVTLLLFARYYHAPVHPLDRALAIGFFLYASFAVVNQAIFEPLLDKYGLFWSFLEVVAFLASLAIWTYAVWVFPVRVRATAQVLSPETYNKISGELDARLRQLNDRLIATFGSKERRS